MSIVIPTPVHGFLPVTTGLASTGQTDEHLAISQITSISVDPAVGGGSNAGVRIDCVDGGTSYGLYLDYTGTPTLADAEAAFTALLDALQDTKGAEQWYVGPSHFVPAVAHSVAIPTSRIVNRSYVQESSGTYYVLIGGTVWLPDGYSTEADALAAMVAEFKAIGLDKQH